MKKLWVIATAIAVAAIAIWLLHRQPREERQLSMDRSRGTAQVAPPAPAQDAAQSQDETNTASMVSEPEAAQHAEETKETFRTDAAGKLILDEETRLKLEAFFARTSPQDIGTAALALVQQLPPAAASQALDVVERYRNYQGAQDATYTDEAPASPEDAIVQLESLHTLRVEHFGPELAKVFYGAEERLARELIELMRLEKDQSLTMEEKADRAQRLRDTLPSVSAADKGEPPPRQRE